MREGERTIYFDHAATTPLDGEVFEKMRPYYTENFGNADSPHSFGRAAMRAVDAARDRVAELVGAKPDEIYFTSAAPKATIGRYSGPPMRRGKREKRASSSLRSSTTPRSLRRSVWKKRASPSPICPSTRAAKRKRRLCALCLRPRRGWWR